MTARIASLHHPEAQRQGVEVDFSLRMNYHLEAKRKIASRAADLVKNGDTLFLDAGTTSFMVAQELVHHNSLVVATNSLAAAGVLRTARGVTLFVVGGRYLQHTRSLIGPMAEDSIRSLQFRKMFLAKPGIDFKHRALTMSSLEEVPIKQMAMERSKKVIMVADRSKFGKPSLISMIPLDVVHTIVTDPPVPEGALAILRALKIGLLTT
jgi:DeoR/GlpR family transcriptional regulator of sugar metabolism